MNRLTSEKRVQIIAALVEGTAINAVSRMTGVWKVTILKLLKDVGDPRKVSTSYVERNNLTLRMQMRRFTPLTNAHSKKIENLGHALALHFVYYNVCRIHQTLRVTPAMEADISDHAWSIEEVVNLL